MRCIPVSNQRILQVMMHKAPRRAIDTTANAGDGSGGRSGSDGRGSSSAKSGRSLSEVLPIVLAVCLIAIAIACTIWLFIFLRRRRRRVLAALPAVKTQKPVMYDVHVETYEFVPQQANYQWRNVMVRLRSYLCVQC